MKDFFFAEGYEELEFTETKSGIEVYGRHRSKSESVLAKFSMNQSKTGIAEVSKFRGGIDAENKRASDRVLKGYFISLEGFTAASIEADRTNGDRSVQLVDASKLVEVLEASQILASDEQAIARANHSIQVANLHDVQFDGIEVLMHRTGYIKVVFYARNKVRTHFALIHYLTPLTENAARILAASDAKSGGALEKLRHLPPAPATPAYVATEASMLAHYRQWLGQECGFIQLDGLPADTDTSSKKLELERLFVPLNAILPQEAEAAQAANRVAETHSIGSLLAGNSHLALLATPGGGKSTLLKRLATAYVFPERREEISDELPDRDWLPLFLRCRELRERAGQPISDLLKTIPAQTNMPEGEAEVFNQHVTSALRAGKVLLLVDGLDEISDEQARKSFANNLRTFLAVYPQIGMVITSREAGYRLVAGVVADACVHAKLAPLNAEDVAWLCEQWHVQVIKDTPQVRVEATQLAKDIWQNTRIRALAENPLLLTTLLVVKRWIGQLPRNRAALYSAAVKVLIMTWNVEGFEPMEEDETLAQLSYVACAMMEKGVQRITYRSLLTLLQEAREELDAELQDARVSAAEFIKRVEHRSSILMRTGQELDEESGDLQDVYEFRHLTFQEYLTARGYAAGEHPGRNDCPALVDVLSPHFTDERWFEVIPLATVLAKRHAEGVIKKLVDIVEEISLDESTEDELNCLVLLHQCILDEAIASPATLERALDQIARLGDNDHDFISLYRGKYAERLRQAAITGFLGGGKDWEGYVEAYDESGIYSKYEQDEDEDKINVADFRRKLGEILRQLENGNRIQRISAALWLKHQALVLTGYHEGSTQSGIDEIKLSSSLISKEMAVKFCAALERMIEMDSTPEQLSACWALAWMADSGVYISFAPSVISRLYIIWRTSQSNTTAKYAAWALSDQKITVRHQLPLDIKTINSMPTGSTWHRMHSTNNESPVYLERIANKAALIMNWYLRSPLNDSELANSLMLEYNYLDVSAKYIDRPEIVQVTQMLLDMGDAGKRILDKRRAVEKARAAEQAVISIEDDDDDLPF
ncbi:MAG: NACHT domain-containing protein [Janthinobacterium lividum]